MTAPGRSTTLGVVFLALFVDCVVFGMLFPLTAEMLKYYQQHDQGGLLAWTLAVVKGWFPNATDAQTAALFGGLIIGTYSLTQFFSAPFWGRLSDRIGRRPILLIGLGGTLLANLLWAFSASFAVLVFARVLAGALSGSVVVANAAVGDIIPPERRARAMGLLGMAFGLGFLLGPAIGAISYHFQPSDFARIGPFHPFTIPALVAASLALVNVIWAVMRFRETLKPELRAHGTGADRSANPLVLFSSRYGRLVPRVNLAFCFYTLLFSGLEATLVFVAADKCGFGPTDVMWLFLAMGGATAAMQGGVFRPFATRVGVRRFGVLGMAVSIPGFVLLAWVGATGQVWALWSGAVACAIGTGLAFPALTTLVSVAADPTQQGAVMGAFRSAGSLGRACGPYVGAVAYFAFTPAAPYLIGAVGLIVPLLLVAVLRVREPGRVEPPRAVT